MDDVIAKITHAEKTTPVKLYLWEKAPLAFPGCHVFRGAEGCSLIFGDWEKIQPILLQNREQIDHYILECDRRRSAMPLLELQNLNARIEPGAILRQGVTVGDNAVILMGAILNIGASVGSRTMVDMGAVLGGRAKVGKDCHIGAGAVLAGVIEPVCNQPVTVGDGVLIGANAVILEGVTVGDGAVVAAGAVVTEDVAPDTVVAGCPARFVKYKDEKTEVKTRITNELR